MISQTRWSTTQTSNGNLGLSTSFFGLSDTSGVLNGSVSGQIGVDEFVFDTGTGVMASLQQPPALTSLLNSNEGCSFII